MQYKPLLKISSFLLILSILLQMISVISVRMNRSRNIIYDHATTGIFRELKNSVDVLAIGDSNVYSAISPMLWWKQYGITGYSWGEPSQRICETYEYLKKIYQYQKPKVVFLEAGSIFRDKTDIDSINSLIKAKLANIFPIVTYHRCLDPHRLNNMSYDGRSLAKGYFLRYGYLAVRKTPEKERKKALTDKYKEINPISRRDLKKCISYCQDHGSEVILLSIPSYSSWSYEKHNTIVKEAEANHVKYLDLNLLLADEIDWSRDTVDRGEHLNFRGAEKTTKFLGRYLFEHKMAEDHRGDMYYKSWDEDLEKCKFIKR